jgi:hypothetical protein
MSGLNVDFEALIDEFDDNTLRSRSGVDAG